MSLVVLSLVEGLVSIHSVRRIAHAAGPWYVAPSGINHPTECNDAAKPCRDIKYVLTNVPDFAPGDTIAVAAGTYAENVTIDKSVHIVGAGAGSTFVDGSGAGRVLTITTGVTVTITGLTIRNGLVSGQDGGGIHNLGMLTLDQAEVRDNKAEWPGSGSGGDGGGIYNGVGGVLTITNGSVLSNAASADSGVGGGIQNFGTAVLTDTVLLSNTAVYGGAMNNQGLAVLRRVVIEHNFAGAGGGFYNTSGTAQLHESAIVHNKGQNEGGGIENNANLTLINVTISNNNLPGGPGGGLFNSGADANASLTNVSIVSNTINNRFAADGGGIKSDSNGSVTLTNTLIAHNVVSNCGVVTSGQILSSGHNLSSDTTCSFSGTNDQNNVDPIVGPLQSGDATQTHALLRGSPAIDAANGAACPSNDQRGMARPQIAGCDIGAYEAVPVDLVANATVAPDHVFASQTLVYTAVVINNSAVTATNVGMSSTLPIGLAFGSCTATQGSCTGSVPDPAPDPVGGDGGWVTGSLGSIDGGGSVTVTVSVTPTMAGVVTTNFAFAAAEPDTSDANDSVSVTATIEPMADLAIGSTATPTSAIAGEHITFMVYVTNTGPTPAAGAIVTASLPVSTSYVSAAGTDWSCEHAGPVGVVTCTSEAEIQVGPAPPISIVATVVADSIRTIKVGDVDGADSIRIFSTRVGSTTFDPVAINNETAISMHFEKRYFTHLPLIQRPLQ